MPEGGTAGIETMMHDSEPTDHGRTGRTVSQPVVADAHARRGHGGENG